MKKLCLTISLAALAASPVIAQEAEKTAAPSSNQPSPNEIVDSAPTDSWISIAPDDLLVMELVPDAKGKARRVVIQLMPEPFSQGWVRNIRKLASAKWWDGTSVNRVQDNYVVQWGDAPENEGEEKALPEGLETVPESEYVAPINADIKSIYKLRAEKIKKAIDEVEFKNRAKLTKNIIRAQFDPYSDGTAHLNGWPVAVKEEKKMEGSMWPVHCYGAVGVGRGYSPDTGSGAELYTVIGHAPRHLDRNIAVVGRIVEGIEHLSSLPRGTGPLGFYENPEERVPIQSIRLASELPATQQPRFEYLSTESDAFAKYADARANRRDPFFIVPAGGADICNIPVPVRRVNGK